jgi:hypothetical protein
MKSDSRKIFFEILKIGFVLIVIGAVLGALYEINWKIEFKIIFGGLFIMLGLIANEISRLFNINSLLSDIHAKTLMQLILIGKKQGVKEDVNDIWETIIEDEKKKLDFQREYGGDVDAKILIGAIIAVVVFALGTVIIIQEFF